MTTNTPVASTAAVSSEAPSLRTWLSIFSLSLGAFLIVATEFLPVGVLPLVASDLRVSVGVAGLMILIPGLVAAIAAPLIVVTLARIPRNRLVLGLGVLLLVANLVVAFAPNFGILIAGRVLVGIALGGFWAVVPSLGVALAGPRWGTRAASTVLAGVSAGTVVALPVGQLIGEIFGWRSVFVAAAALSAVILLAQAVILPRLEPASRMRFRQFAEILRTPMARVGLVASALVFAGQFAASTFVTPFLVGEGGLEPGLVTTLFLGYGVAGIIGTIVGGSLVAKSRLGTLVGVSLALGAVLILLPLLSDAPVSLAILFIIWGGLFGIVPLSLQTWMMASTPHAPEAASAVLVSVLQAAIAAGSLLGGVLVDGSGVSAAFFAGGALVLVSVVYPLVARGRRAD